MPTNPPRKRRWLKRTIIVAVIVLVVLAMLVALAPTLLSTGAGKGLIASIVNQRLRGRVEMNTVGLAWGRGQAVTGLKLYDPSGKVVLLVDRIEMPDTSLWSLLRGANDLGTIRIVNMDADIAQTAGGETNLQSTLSSPNPSPATPKIHAAKPAQSGGAGPAPTVRGKFQIVNGNVKFSALDSTRTEVKDINVTVDAADLNNLHVLADCRVLEEGKGGRIDAKCDIKNGMGADGAIDFDHAAIDGTVDLTDLPVEVADQLLRLKGAISALVGPTLNGRLRVVGNINQFDATLTAKSLHLDADVRVGIHNKVLTATPPSRITLAVSPETWKAAAQDLGAPGTLLQPFEIVLAVDQLNIPITDSGGNKSVDWANASLRGGLEIGDVVADTPTGHIVVRQTKASVSLKNAAALVADLKIPEIAVNNDKVGVVSLHDASVTLTTNLNTDVLAGDLGAKIAAISYQPPDGSQKVSLVDTAVALRSDDATKLVALHGNSAFTITEIAAPGSSTPAPTPAVAGTPQPVATTQRETISTPGKISIDTEIRGLAFVHGKPDFDQASWKTDTRAENLPVASIDSFLKKKGELTEVLGTTTSLLLTGGSGPDKSNELEVALHSGNADVVISGTLDKNKVLTLRKDATASMRVTPGLSKDLLAKLNPLLREAESGKDPIRLTVHKEGFSVKVSPFDPITMNGDIQLDIGTLILRRSGGVTDQVLDFFVHLGTDMQSRSEFPAIFTTLKAQVRNGTITTNDLWFTTDQHDLTMGSKAVVTPRGPDWYANVVLGIAGDTFARTRLVGKAINPDAVFEVTVRGKLDHLNIDPGKLAAKFAPMLLHSIKGTEAFEELFDQGVTAVTGKHPKDKSGSMFVTTGWPNKPKAVEASAAETTENSDRSPSPDKAQNDSQDSPGLLDKIQGLLPLPKKKKNKSDDD